jgi:hypothetical protein
MSPKGMMLILISMGIFGVLNLIENLIHYNIGRSYDKMFQFNIPPFEDFIKIAITMGIFGLAQGILTEYFIQD